MPWTCTEVGFTLHSPLKRKSEHDRHLQHTTNSLRNLDDAIAKHLTDGRICMRHFVITNPYEPSQVKVAEHVCSMLYGAYIFQGGLNGECGGVKTTAGAVLYQYWMQNLIELMNNGDMEKRVEVEWKKYIQRVEQSKVIEDVKSTLREPVDIDQLQDEAKALLETSETLYNKDMEDLITWSNKALDVIDERLKQLEDIKELQSLFKDIDRLVTRYQGIQRGDPDALSEARGELKRRHDVD